MPARLQKLEKLLDLDKFLEYLCVETVIWDWDGYPLNRNDELQQNIQPALASVNAGLGKNYPNEINRVRHAIKQRAKVMNDHVDRELKKAKETPKAK